MLFTRTTAELTINDDDDDDDDDAQYNLKRFFLIRRNLSSKIFEFHTQATRISQTTHNNTKNSSTKHTYKTHDRRTETHA